MCGIAGFSGYYGQDTLRGAMQALRHRGPDDCGIFLDRERNVGLAHTRLSIIDLSAAGCQPMMSPDGQVVLVFNGEIYNFRDLRRELEEYGHVLRGHSDTEVLLHLYLEYGQEMLPRLNGIFAFAIWDARDGTLFLARDGMGVKPLYVAQLSRGIVFASEIKALRHFWRPEEVALDISSLARYATFLWCPGDGTPLHQVRKLGPGEAMLLADGCVRKHWRWRVPAIMRAAPQPLDALEAMRQTRALLKQAVRRQMVADVPVGAFLSGGLDSSAIVALACSGGQDIRCFTIRIRGGMEQGETEDLPYARQVARHLGVQLHEVEVDASGMAQDVAGMVHMLDEPLADPATLNAFYISRLARQNGIKVLLSGAGGDDLFSGYRRHLAVMMERYWSWWPRPMRRFLSTTAGRLDQRKALGRRLQRLFAHAGKTPQERLTGFFHWLPAEKVMSLFHEDLRAELQQEPLAQPLLDTLSSMPAHASPLQRMLALEQRHFLADHNLLYTDKMSMAAGVEARVPFLDPNLEEFAATVPDRLRVRGSTAKWLLKKAAEPLLPRNVIYRPKTGFGAPLRHWLRHELREMLRDTLSESTLRTDGIFSPAAVQRLIQDNEEGKTDAAYPLFALLCINIWKNNFLVHTATASHP